MYKSIFPNLAVSNGGGASRPIVGDNSVVCDSPSSNGERSNRDVKRGGAIQ